MPVQETLVDLFFNPPMAIARLGSSPEPMESFNWVVDKSSHGSNNTFVVPDISLHVGDDGSVSPYMPEMISFRDDNFQVKPVAPFFELWGVFQNSESGEVSEAPITLDILKEHRLSTKDISFRVRTANEKAHRRTQDAACAFMAEVDMRGDNHQVQPLLASSRRTADMEPLVFPDKPVPLGNVQVIRPINTSTQVKDEVIDQSVVRIRYTPAKGTVYAPPGTIQGSDVQTPTGLLNVTEFFKEMHGRVHEIVPEENRFLNQNSTWSKYSMVTGVFEDPQPQDGYDGADNLDNRSWSVVDDTCDTIIEASVVVQGRRLNAQARSFSGPQDFAPDRRPFLSLADDLADRDFEPIPEDAGVLQSEVIELFRRIFETASLINLDDHRQRGLSDNVGYQGDHVVPTEGLPKTDGRSMTKEDAPFVDRAPPLMPGQVISDYADLENHTRLPYSEVPTFVHSQFQDGVVLIDFLKRRREHVRQLVRPPFGTVPQWEDEPSQEPNPSFRDPRVVRDRMHDMRMPPYMRDSNYFPLSLTKRQYDILMGLLDSFEEEAND